MICANCGSQRPGSYCGHCGQNDRDYHRALPPLLGDLLHETFELDSRLLRTLKLLLFKPGALAVEFSENRRASYVSPIRLYLFVSITFFFLLSITTEIEPLRDARVQAAEESEAVAATDTDRLLRHLDDERRVRANEILERDDTSVVRLILLQLAQSVQENPDELERVEIFFLRQVIDALYEPQLMFDHLLNNLPIVVFLMLPVYALLLKMFYFRRHRYYVEHLVFATHLHSFAFIVFTVLLLIPDEIGVGWLGIMVGIFSALLWLGVAVYHFLALKNYYEGGFFGTLVRFSGLMFVYMLLLLPVAFVIVIFVTALMI